MVRTGLSNTLYKTNEVESFAKQVSYFARSDWLNPVVDSSRVTHASILR